MSRLSILLMLSLAPAWTQAQVCPTNLCTINTSTRSGACDQVAMTAKIANLPATIWDGLQRGEPQRLLVSIQVADLTSLSRAQLLQIYESRKQAILDSLPNEGARMLRRLDQLPMMEFEFRTESALRPLLAHCWVAEIYLDREEPALSPKGMR